MKSYFYILDKERGSKMKKGIFVLVLITMFLLVGCEDIVNELPGGDDQVIEPGDDLICEDGLYEKEGECVTYEETCEVGYSEVFLTCVDPLLKEDDFSHMNVTYYLDNTIASKMITNIEYNHIAEILTFDLSYDTIEDIDEMRIVIVDTVLDQEIYDESIRYGEPFTNPVERTEPFYESFLVDSLPRESSYKVTVYYSYRMSSHLVSADKSLVSFYIDTTGTTYRDIPRLNEFNLINAEEDKLNISLRVKSSEDSLNELKVKVFDYETGLDTGISFDIDLDTYYLNGYITVPFLEISGLQSYTVYGLKLYGSGYDGVDTYTDVLLFDTGQQYFETDHPWYEREGSHYFNFNLVSFTETNEGLLMTYEFIDERETYTELETVRQPIIIEVKNSNGYTILETELDPFETEFLLSSNLYAQADLLSIWYYYPETKQYHTIAVWGMDAIEIE
jgi:hypothetical protein